MADRFVDEGLVWSASVQDPNATRSNVWLIYEKLEPVLENLRPHASNSPGFRPEDRELYEDGVLHLLYQRYYPRLYGASGRFGFFREFSRDWNHYFGGVAWELESSLQPSHVFACYYQIQRAFHRVFDHIIGNTLPAARLRAAIWQSVFTADMRRYRRTLYRRLVDFPTLITGPSGSGKELVARAISASRYFAFDPSRLEFPEDGDHFHAVNLAALSPTLIESELFGHRRGAFTGAIADRKGWFESCPAAGCVFLDELGELDVTLQVKLLRVLETRRFSAVGDTHTREFSGKLIAATNRDLALHAAAGQFREDLYYRLCADQIVTPSLAEQFRDSPQALHEALVFMVRRVAGEESGTLLDEAEAWILDNLGPDYDWPGNYRELEQCVRNLVLRRSYRPLMVKQADGSFWERAREGRLTMEELLTRYAALVYRQSGSYEEAARRLNVDRRTVKTKVQEYLASQLPGRSH